MEPRDESKIPTRPNPIVPRSARPDRQVAPPEEPAAAEPEVPDTDPETPAPPPLRIGRYPVVGWHVVVLVAVLLAPVVAVLAQLLPWGSMWLWLLRVLLLGAVGYTGYRAWHTYPSDPPEPKRRPLPEPTPEVVELERPAEPPQEIVEPALYCRVCGKPLTERQDQELGVDNECYVQHGAQRQYRPNPAYPQWQEDMRRVQARETDEQALADARHARELEDWKSATERGAQLWTREREQWHLDCARQEAFRRTSEGRQVIARAQTWGAAAAGALGLLILSLS